jgi:AcrR family transcriptional regulator
LRDRPNGRSAAAAPSRRWSLASGEKIPGSREKILDVAEALFARRGYAGVGLREVADAVGLGKSSLFHHFRGKSQLYFEVLGRVLGRIRDRLAAVVESDAAPAARLERWVEALVDAIAEHPSSARLLLRALVEDETPRDEREPGLVRGRQILDETLGGVRRLLREGVASGAFREVSEAYTVQTLIGATVYHFASGELGEGLLGQPLLSAESVARHKRELRELLRSGLGAGGPAAARPPGTMEGDPWRS